MTFTATYISIQSVLIKSLDLCLCWCLFDLLEQCVIKDFSTFIFTATWNYIKDKTCHRENNDLHLILDLVQFSVLPVQHCQGCLLFINYSAIPLKWTHFIMNFPHFKCWCEQAFILRWINLYLQFTYLFYRIEFTHCYSYNIMIFYYSQLN